jgi:hypothetical protein
VEGRLYDRKVCVGCRLHDVARERLDDGSGAIRPELAPLVEALATHLKGTPETRLQWLTKPRVIELLTALGTGKLPLDHAALDAYPVQRQVAFLRGLLVTAGCLPDVDPSCATMRTGSRIA